MLGMKKVKENPGPGFVGCSRKLGLMVSNWVISPDLLVLKWGIHWGYNPLILTFDPNFQGHPSSCFGDLLVMKFPPQFCGDYFINHEMRIPEA